MLFLIVLLLDYYMLEVTYPAGQFIFFTWFLIPAELLLEWGGIKLLINK